MRKQPNLWTVGEIARHFDVALHRVEYAIRSRNIEPTHRAGNARVFDDAAVTLIGNALHSREQ